MRNLLLLFIRNGGFVTFFLMEVVCFFIIVNFNTKQNTVYSYNANRLGGVILRMQQSVYQYVNLAERADSLSAQNAALQTALYNLRNERSARRDTMKIQVPDSLNVMTTRPQYEFIAAEVLSNSVSLKSNWLLINRGTADGVTPDMGVVCNNGVIGITRHVSAHFATVMSVLNPQTRISAALRKSGIPGSLVWNGKDPGYMELRDIPKHVIINPGEAVYTSGFSGLFPKDILIGYTGKPSLKEGSNFYTIPVKLAHDPAATSDVYVVKNIFYTELKGLNAKIQDEQ